MSMQSAYAETSTAPRLHWIRGTINRVPTFPSLKAAKLQSILEKRLGYVVKTQRGSHKKLVSDAGYPQLTFAFHDGDEVPPGLVRKILTKDVGLTLDAASQLLGIG